jgi:hypothetical protein
MLGCRHQLVFRRILLQAYANTWWLLKISRIVLASAACQRLVSNHQIFYLALADAAIHQPYGLAPQVSGKVVDGQP